MKQYIVVAEYYDWNGLLTDRDIGIVDETKTYYNATNTDDKVRELIQDIKDGVASDISVQISVYELGNNVTDKMILKDKNK